MFRTVVRQFAWTARCAAGTVEKLSVAEIDAAYRHGIYVSKAQGIAQRGLVDGIVVTNVSNVKSRGLSTTSDWKDATHSNEQAL